MAAKNERSALGELLVEIGLIDREQLNAALAQQRSAGGRLGRILSERKVVDEDRVAKALAGRLGLESVSLGSLKIHEKVLSLIPATLAVKHGALPIAIKRTSQAEFIYVVMSDPLDAEALSELSRAAGRDIRVLVAPTTDLDRAIEQHYKTSAKPAPEVGSVGRDRLSPPAATLAPPLPASSSAPAIPPLRSEAKKVPTSSPPPVPGPVGQPPRTRAPTSGTPLPPLDGGRPSEARKAPSSPPGAIPPAVQAAAANAKAPPRPPVLPAQARGPTNPPRPDVRTSQPGLPDKPPPRPEPEDPRRVRGPAPSGTLPLAPHATPRPVLHGPPPAPVLAGSPISASHPPPGPSRISALSSAKAAEPPPVALPDDALSLDMNIEDMEARWSQPLVPANGAALESGALAQPVSPPKVRGGRGEVPPLEPVTTEARVREGADLGDSTEAGLLELNPEPVEVIELGDGPEDIKTSQVELESLESAELMRRQLEAVSAASPPKAPGFHDGRAIPGAMEVPVDISGAPSPFADIPPIDVPAGLERTGIIPAVDWENEEFMPPPLIRAEVDPLLAGTDDIPISPAHVEVRGSDGARSVVRRDEFEPEPSAHGEARFDTILEARNAVVEPESKKRRVELPPLPAPEDTPGPFEAAELAPETPSPPVRATDLAAAEDSDASEMPVIEPSSLVSLIDEDGFAKSEDTGEGEAARSQGDEDVLATAVAFEDDEPRAEIDTGEASTNPRIPQSSLRTSRVLDPATSGATAPAAEPGPEERFQGRARGQHTPLRDFVPDPNAGLDGPELRTPPATALSSDDLHPVEDEAQRMVLALVAGESLNSAERAHVVLALGRLLLRKGLISQDELAAELRR